MVIISYCGPFPAISEVQARVSRQSQQAALLGRKGWENGRQAHRAESGAVCEAGYALLLAGCDVGQPPPASQASPSPVKPFLPSIRLLNEIQIKEHMRNCFINYNVLST